MTLEADSLPWLLCGDVDYFMLAYTRMIAAVDGFHLMERIRQQFSESSSSQAIAFSSVTERSSVSESSSSALL